MLDVADDVLIPIEPEPLAFQPTYSTIEHVVKPRGLPYMVVVCHYRVRTNASADGFLAGQGDGLVELGRSDGRGGHGERLGERGHEPEAGGVVLDGHLALAGAAGRAGMSPTS
ncbi:hypothetical protein AB0392_40765 [Nonomuraea angiospora]|uniref:hypothetical protein n=1 Tax=Nonomuraea angiospora TaxID=46172 RepID=UPI00344E1A35